MYPSRTPGGSAGGAGLLGAMDVQRSGRLRRGRSPALRRAFAWAGRPGRPARLELVGLWCARGGPAPHSRRSRDTLPISGADRGCPGGPSGPSVSEPRSGALTAPGGGAKGLLAAPGVEGSWGWAGRWSSERVGRCTCGGLRGSLWWRTGPRRRRGCCRRFPGARKRLRASSRCWSQTWATARPPIGRSCSVAVGAAGGARAGGGPRGRPGCAGVG